MEEEEEKNLALIIWEENFETDFKKASEIYTLCRVVEFLLIC